MSGLTAVAFIVAPSVTLANPPEGADAHDTADTDPAPPEKAAPAARSSKKTAKASADAKQAPPKKAKKGRRVKETTSAAPAKAKKNKKTASRSSAGSRKKGAKKAPPDAQAPPPCLGPAVALDRGGEETETLVLVDCHGTPRAEAGARLSILARPWGTGRTTSETQELDVGLLARIDAIARKFPGKTISLVSGYRPRSRGSLHQSGRAVDLRVADVDNRELVAFCRGLKDTGCGFYPNSSFVHVDVRAPGTGVVHWIDASGPGESPRYVTQWPPPDDKPQKEPEAAAPPDPPAPEVPEVDFDPYDAAADEAPPSKETPAAR